MGVVKYDRQDMVKVFIKPGYLYTNIWWKRQRDYIIHVLCNKNRADGEMLSLQFFPVIRSLSCYTNNMIPHWNLYLQMKIILVCTDGH